VPGRDSRNTEGAFDALSLRLRALGCRDHQKKTLLDVEIVVAVFAIAAVIT
jgi:hypothetical protein